MAAGALALRTLVQGLQFIAQPVHPTFFPYPIAPTVHAARVSLVYQANARAATATTGARINWGTYIIGYLIMTWGGTFWTHRLLDLAPPMLYSLTPYIIYISTHMALTLLTTLIPALLTAPVLAALDTVLFPLDALVRVGAITAATSLLSSTPSHLQSSPLTHLLIGALASAGGGLTASTLSTWSASWVLSTPPVLRAPTLSAFIWGSMDVWGGALVAGVCGTLSGHQAFWAVQEVVGAVLRGDGGRFGKGEVWMGEVQARAVAAGVLGVCFGMRALRNYWWVSWTAVKMSKGVKARVK